MKAPYLIIGGLAALPLIAMAQEDLSYTWLQLDYVYLDIEEAGDNDSISDLDDGDGVRIRGSYGFDASPLGWDETWFVFGNYTETEGDVDFLDDEDILRPADTDVIRLDLGAGFAMPLNQMSDLVFRLAYSDIDIEDFDFGATDTTSIDDLSEDDSDGYFIDGRWRGQVNDVIELSAGLRWTDVESNDNLSFVGNALFEITQNWGVNVSADVGEDLTTIGLGARYTF